LIVTLLWSAYEAGVDYWQLVPRLGVFLILAILNALITPILVNPEPLCHLGKVAMVYSSL
jgi:glucose dehydrogenase